MPNPCLMPNACRGASLAGEATCRCRLSDPMPSSMTLMKLAFGAAMATCGRTLLRRSHRSVMSLRTSASLRWPLGCSHQIGRATAGCGLPSGRPTLGGVVQVLGHGPWASWRCAQGKVYVCVCNMHGAEVGGQHPHVVWMLGARRLALVPVLSQDNTVLPKVVRASAPPIAFICTSC